MRELFYDMVDLSNQIGRPATCVYWILVRTVPLQSLAKVMGSASPCSRLESERKCWILPCVQSESCPWHRCWRAGA